MGPQHALGMVARSQDVRAVLVVVGVVHVVVQGIDVWNLLAAAVLPRPSSSLQQANILCFCEINCHYRRS